LNGFDAHNICPDAIVLKKSRAVALEPISGNNDSSAPNERIIVKRPTAGEFENHASKRRPDFFNIIDDIRVFRHRCSFPKIDHLFVRVDA
jgi:hypothetical protein